MNTLVVTYHVTNLDGEFLFLVTGQKRKPVPTWGSFRAGARYTKEGAREIRDILTAAGHQCEILRATTRLELVE
jgi:hypothetical protein